MRGIRGVLRGRRRKLVAGTVATASVLGVLAISAFAVHDEKFQLDGDVSASTTTSVGGSLQPYDWDSLFNAGGTNISPSPTGFSASAFTRDFKTNPTTGAFVTSDDSTYATGSKDTLPISGWQCNQDNNVNNKIDVSNAYATAYKSATGDDILYFALERAYNGGDANVGFWFMQDAVGCSSSGASTDFTGAHRNGDLLIVSAFTKGGTVSGVDVYRWEGVTATSAGALNPTPVVQGGADCKATGGADTACATVNTGTISTPWLTNSSSKGFGVGRSLPIASFFEGGLNLTKANLAGRCFNTFLGDTRSAQSPTATLFDFAGGTVGECTSTTVTTPTDGSGTPITSAGLTLPTDPANASLTVKDAALVTVTGVPSFNGTVTFNLCGPSATSSTTTCDTGGVSVGSTNVTANGTVNSPAATVTTAGRYCWRAVFSGDTTKGVPGSSDSRASECFVVKPVKAGLTTQAGDGPVDFGSPITDTATLTNTVHRPGSGGPAGSDGSINPTSLGGDAQGTITFKAYDNATCSGTPAYTTTVSVSGDGTYGPVSFTPTTPGTYHWVASYPGDSPNTLAADTGACDDAAEDVVVRQIPTEVKTKQSWFPNDTATISASSGNLAAGGTVTFALYDNATCTGSPVYGPSAKTITGGSPSETVGTSNTSFEITTGYADAADSIKGPYSWKVTYAPAGADTAHLGVQSACNAEHFSVKYTNDAGPGTVFP